MINKLQSQLSSTNLNDFFVEFFAVVKYLNEMIESQNGKKDAISISKVGDDINLSYDRTEKSNGAFLDVIIKQVDDFDSRLLWVQEFIFNACRDNGCFELVQVFGAKERGDTAGFHYVIDGKDHKCILWERPEVVYIVMRHAEPEDHDYDLTSKGYEQVVSVAGKLKDLFPDEVEWSKNCAINLPSGVLRITCTASRAGEVLDGTLDKFNIYRREWLGLKSLNSKGTIPYGTLLMTQNTDYKYQFMFTHWDVAQKAFPIFMKHLNLEEDLANHKLKHAECVVMYPDGKVVHLTP
ncbi:MAG: hypothetical protein WD471_01370 [Candidatus Paceibacterota bacterium]